VNPSGIWTDFMPHGHCYQWRPDVLWLNVVSDGLIFAAYMAIPITLVIALRKVKYLPYRWIFVMFAAFISLCGVTHLMEIVTIWQPAYYLEGFIKAATGAVSIATAVLFIPILPRALEAVLRELSSDLEKNGS
jgi:two-component system, NtrC family, sensor kinase